MKKCIAVMAAAKKESVRVLCMFSARTHIAKLLKCIAIFYPIPPRRPFFPARPLITFSECASLHHSTAAALPMCVHIHGPMCNVVVMQIFPVLFFTLHACTSQTTLLCPCIPSILWCACSSTHILQRKALKMCSLYMARKIDKNACTARLRT
jgi:hypothetical protein